MKYGLDRLITHLGRVAIVSCDEEKRMPTTRVILIGVAGLLVCTGPGFAQYYTGPTPPVSCPPYGNVTPSIPSMPPDLGLTHDILSDVQRQGDIQDRVRPKRNFSPSSKVRKVRPPVRKRIVKKPRRVIPRVKLPDTIRVALPNRRLFTIGSKPRVSKQSFVLSFNPGLGRKAVDAFVQKYGLEIVGKASLGSMDRIVLRLKYPKATTPAQVMDLARKSGLANAQPNYFYYPAAEPGRNMAKPASTAPLGEDTGLQYALSKLGVTRLASGESGKGVALAVIDSGVSGSHPAVAQNVSARFSAFPDAGDDMLNLDHGTAVASIIAARQGMRGVASNVTLLSAQVFRYGADGNMVADSFDIVRGIDWAVAQGARILNLSFAGSRDALLEDALKRASEKGVIIVAAAGNEGADAPAAFPAAYDNVIAVTATDADDGLYDFANRGDHVELAAPGVDILVAAGADGYGLQTGTSMATAYISGSIALMLEKEPDLTVEEIKMRLAESALDLGVAGRDPDFGYGRLDAYKAVLAASSTALSQ